MQSQFFFRMIFSALVLNYAHADIEQIREDITYRFNINEENSELIDNIHLITFLRENGIIADSESEISVHNEDNYINLSCFDCIIINKPSEEQIPNSFNERPEK